MSLYCKNCGEQLENVDGQKIAVCDFCGMEQTLPTLDNPEKLELFAKANEHRISSRFDIAKKQYESIIAQYPDDNEAYWCKLLCVYGIEYVDDDLTEKKIPTCHRTVTESIFDNKDYKLIMSRATEEEKAIYEAEAKEIDRIQKEILAKADKEEPYDIFICYKETELDGGKRTVDAQHATKIYTYLTEHGYKVFFSRITLKNKLGTEYEPIIYSALKSAKVMLHVSTSVEHTNAPWVRNEWSRFLEFMNDDVTKIILPCIAQMGPYELPDELGKFQVADMTDLDFYENLLLQINKKFGKNIEAKSEEKKEKSIKKSRQAEQEDSGSGNKAPDQIHNFLSRAKLYLEDGDYAKANEFAENCLNIHFEFADAYVIKLLCDLRVNVLSKIVQKPDFINNPNYKKALRFADGSLKAELENLEKQYYYNVAISCGNDLLSPKNYARIKENLEKAKGYKQADEMLASLPNLKAEQEKEKFYKLALPLLKCDLTDDETYEEAKLYLTKAGDFKDAKQILEELYNQRNKQLDAKALLSKKESYDEAKLLIKSGIIAVNNYNRARELLLKADDYKDAKQLLESLPNLREEQEKARHYELALPLLKSDLTKDGIYEKIEKYLTKADDYKDAKQLLENLPKMRAEQEKAGFYELALQFLKSDFTVGTNYEKTQELLEKADDYKDAKQLLESLPQRKQEQIDAKLLAEKKRNYELALPLLKSDLTIDENYKNAQTYLEKADDYKDAKQLLDQLPKKRDAQIREVERRKKKKRITMAIIAVASAVLVVFIVLLFSLIIPSANFTKANDLLMLGDYKQAIAMYENLNGWGNSNNKLNIANTLYDMDQGYCSYESGIKELVDNGAEVTVSYNYNGGSTSLRSGDTTFVYNKNNRFNGFPSLSKSGYKFSQWNRTSTVLNITNDSNKIKFTFSASWNITSYTVSYNLNGGNASNIQGYDVVDTFTLNNPTKTGYTFIGWTGTDLTEKTMTVTIPKGSTGNREYTANWEVNIYNISYKLNGGSVSGNPTTYTIENNAITLPKPTKTGYTFAGWTGTDLSNKTMAVTIPKGSYGDREYTAYWEANTYNISYNLNGGSVSGNPATYTIENNAITLANPTKTGYTFIGWMGTDLTEKTMTVTIPKGSIEDRSYTANWKANTYTITYDANGGTASKTEDTVTYDSDYTVPTPTRAGYTFVAWKNNGKTYSGGTWKDVTDVTLTAEWISELIYSISSNGSYYVVSGINKTQTQYKILSEYNGKPVKEIAKECFKDCTNLTSIEIPDSVVSIGDSAFSDCSSLTSIEIPYSVTNIGDYAFAYCGSLTSITIPESVASIGTVVFTSRNITIYCETESIPSGWDSDWDFYTTSIVWGYKYALIDDIMYGIKDGTATVVRQPSSNMITVHIPSIITYKGARHNVTSIGDYAFNDCSSLTSIEIPDSVTSIGSYAFFNCSSLTSITIPSSVTNIANIVFGNCNKLKIYCEVESKPSGWASNWHSNRPVVWGGEYEITIDEITYKIKDDKAEVAGIHVSGDIIIPTSIIYNSKYYAVTSIDDSSFYDCDSLTSIEIPNSVTSIGDYAFAYCDSLTSVTFEEGSQLTSIGEEAFYYCYSLTSIEIPDSVTSIGDHTFSYCYRLTSIEIPDSVTSIGYGAFGDCSSLISIEIPDSVTSIGEKAFYSCNKLTIYCEVTSKPSSWHSNWNYSSCPVVWGYKG